MDRDPERAPTIALTAATNSPLSNYQYKAGVFIGGMEVFMTCFALLSIVAMLFSGEIKGNPLPR